MTATATPMPPIVSGPEWEKARAELLSREKELMWLKDSVSVFLGDGEHVFHTWQTFDRGEEPFMVVFDLLDLTPYGRQETWEDSPKGWPLNPPYEWMRLADSY